MKLIITRHGQTEDNVRGITMGQKNSPLTAEGLNQAQLKATKLKNMACKIDYIYTSDLGRCVRTSNTFSKQLGIDKVIKEKGLREVCFGRYEGLPYEVIPSIKGGYINKKFPGGESNKDMQKRVIEVVNEIYRKHSNGCVLLVTHSGPIAVILSTYYNFKFIDTIKNKFNHEDIIELDLKNELV